MTQSACQTTKQFAFLKGIQTNQYRQNQALIIHHDIFSEASCQLDFTPLHMKQAFTVVNFDWVMFSFSDFILGFLPSPSPAIFSDCLFG